MSIESLKREISELQDRNNILLAEVSEIRDPENVSLGEAIDVLVHTVATEGYENFGVWTSMVDGVAWSITAQRFEEGALTPEQRIAQLMAKIDQLEDAS